MSSDTHTLKIAIDKVKQIDDTLAKIDEVVVLISAFTQKEENKVLFSKLIENIDDVKSIVGSLDLMQTVTDDINKGTFLGNRKLDIDIAKNKTGVAEATTFESALAIWGNTTNTVYYNKATVTFVDGVVMDVVFVNDDAQPITVSTHGAIVAQLMKHVAFTAKLENTSVVGDVGGKTGTIIRIVDTTGHSSNVDRIVLHATTGAYVSQTPTYYWALSTSALQTLANRVSDIIAFGNDIDKNIVLFSRIDELSDLQASLSDLLALHVNLTELLQIDTYAQQVAIDKTNAALSATSAAQSATTATQKATLATQEADRATEKANEIKAITAQAQTLAPGQLVTVTYNAADGKFTFSIPQGAKGDRGDAFAVNAIGTISQRSLYDAQIKGFSFLATDEAMIYFKASSTSGDWTVGSPFGKGDKGDTGDTGNGIASFAFVSTTHASGFPGQSGGNDTYRITMTDTTTFDYVVHNGIDSDVNKAYVDSHMNDTNNPHNVTKFHVELGNVDNTSDVNKPISTLQQQAFNLKAPIESPTFTGMVTIPTAKTTRAVETVTPASTVEFFYRTNGTDGILRPLSATAFKAWLQSIGATGMKIKNIATFNITANNETAALPFTISDIRKVFVQPHSVNAEFLYRGGLFMSALNVNAYWYIDYYGSSSSYGRGVRFPTATSVASSSTNNNAGIGSFTVIEYE